MKDQQGCVEIKEILECQESAKKEAVYEELHCVCWLKVGTMEDPARREGQLEVPIPPFGRLEHPNTP